MIPAAFEQLVTTELQATLRKNSSVITGDTAWDIAGTDPPKGLKVTHQDTVFIEQPQAAGYEYVLENAGPVPPKTCAPSIQATVLFCLAPQEALDLLLQRAVTVERALPQHIDRSDHTNGIGQFGVMWRWEEGGLATITFMRHNAVVALRGICAWTQIEALARDWDERLMAAKTAKQHVTKTTDFLPTSATQVKVTERLDLGMAKNEPADRLFFTTTDGSVNRDVEQPDRWYYRAGLQVGSQTLTVIRLKQWRPPTLEHMTVEVQ